MDNIKIFSNNEFGEIRTAEIDGKPYFVASDVAKALGYAKPNNAISTHCRGTLKWGIGVQTGVRADGTPAIQEVDMLVIPEGDIYRLSARSKLPSAEKFEKWVFDDVLPSIRKNGGYLMNQENMTPEQVVANALVVAQNILDKKDKEIERMRPKEVFADSVASSKDSILIGELAKLICQNGYSVGQNRLFTWMRDNGYLMVQGASRNIPKQRYVEQGLFEIKESSIANPDGSVRLIKTTKVTAKGQQYFIQKFLQFHQRE